MTATGSFVNCSSHHQRNNPSRTKQDTSLDTGTYFTPSKNTADAENTRLRVCCPEVWGGSLSKHQQSCTETEQPSGPSQFSTLEKAFASSLPVGLGYYLIMI